MSLATRCLSTPASRRDPNLNPTPHPSPLTPHPSPLTPHPDQASLYASRPGHAAVANVGLRGLFYKDSPSFDELLLQASRTAVSLEVSSSNAAS